MLERETNPRDSFFQVHTFMKVENLGPREEAVICKKKAEFAQWQKAG